MANGQLESLFRHLGFDPEKMQMVYGKTCKMPKFTLCLKQKTIEFANRIFKFANPADVEALCDEEELSEISNV